MVDNSLQDSVLRRLGEEAEESKCTWSTYSVKFMLLLVTWKTLTRGLNTHGTRYGNLGGDIKTSGVE